jgi:ribosomal protein S18 acetylase RimI-like enzyme
MTSEISIERAATRDTARVADVLARAFEHDPMVRWPLGDVADPLDRITETFRLLDSDVISAGLMWVANSCDAAALWLDPAGQTTFESIGRDTELAMCALMADGGVRHRAMWEWISSLLPDEPTWFLEHIGVDPSCQGLGLGSALIRHGLELADIAGLPAVLETSNPRNVPYYESFGFRVFTAGAAPLDGPEIWFMRRDPS